MLLTAKSLLAPPKEQTISRLELMAVVTAIKHDSPLIAEYNFKVNEGTFITGSEIVFHYISKKEKRH